MATVPQMECKIEVDARVMTFKPGDKLVIEFQENLTQRAVDEIQEMTAKGFQVPMSDVWILTNGAKLRVLSKEDG